MRTPSVETPYPDTVERQVLTTLEALLAEIGGHPGEEAVRPDHVLDRDLGIGSLERVELLLRLEQQLGVRLPDAVMAAAETPADLVATIRTAALAPAEPMPVRQELAEPGTAAPAYAATLIDLLEAHAQAQPERLHILLRQEDGTEAPITYGAPWERAAVVAADLRERGMGRGQSVALMLRTEAAFFESFFGILIAGAVPVPLYPLFRRDRLEEYARRQVGMLRNADARLLITFGDAERVAHLLCRLVPAHRSWLAGHGSASRRHAGPGCLPRRRAARAGMSVGLTGSAAP